MSIRGQVEDAVVAALRPLHQAETSGYLQTLAPYSGDTSPSREDQDFQKATQGGLPAVLVQTGGGTYERRTMGRKSDLVLEIILLVASCNYRSQEADVRGDVTSPDPGIYDILEDIRARLFNRPLVGVTGACTARPISEGPVLRSADRTIWEAVYEIRTDAVEAPLSDEDGDYTAIDNDLNFPAADDGAPANPVVEFTETLS